MGFQIAELFIDLNLRGATFTAGLSAVKESLNKFGDNLEKVGKLAERFLEVTGAMAAFAAHEWMHAEQANRNFVAALSIIGKTYEEVGEQEEAFFKKIEGSYVIMEDDVKALATQAIKLGASFTDVNKIVEVGIGLGDRYFGGNSEEGVQAITLAQHGQLHELQRLIPELRSATSLQDALNLVMAKGAEGLKFSEARANSLEGGLSRLWVQVKKLAESFGQLLSPQIKAMTDFVQRGVMFINSMSDAQKNLVIHTLEVGVAVAAVVAMAPKILSAFKLMWDVTSSLSKVLLSMGQMLFTVITGPIGGFILAIGIAAAAVILFAGTGDTIQERFSTGFSNILDMANTFLGGWRQMQIGWETLTTTTAGNINKGWEWLVELFDRDMIAIEGIFKTTLQLVITTWDSGLGTLKALWDSFIDYLDGKPFVAPQDILKQNGAALVANLQSKTEAGVLDIKTRQDASHTSHEAMRVAYDEDTKNSLTDLGQELSKLPTLSDTIKGMVSDLKKKSGMEEFVKKLEDLQKQFQTIKVTPDGFPKLDGGVLAPADTVKQKPTYTSLQDSFKDTLANILYGEKLKKQEDIAVQQLKAAEKAAKALDKVNENLEEMAMAGVMA